MSLSEFGWDFEASPIILADNRPFLAISTGPKTLDRSFDLFALFRLDLRPLAMTLESVDLDNQTRVYALYEMTLFCCCDEVMES